MHVYENVRQYMKEHHLQQEDVARKARIPESAFYEMLSGGQLMYAEDLRAICYALNVSADLFIDIKTA